MLLSFDPMLLQSAVARDTIVALTVATRSPWDYIEGVVQLVVLAVALVALITVILGALALRRGVTALEAALTTLTTDAKPLIDEATRTVAEARGIVETVRTEVDKTAETVGAIRVRVDDLTQSAADRLEDVNALLDVVQQELEDTVMAATSAVRGVRVGATAGIKTVQTILGIGRDAKERRRRRRAAESEEQDMDDAPDDVASPRPDDHV